MRVFVTGGTGLIGRRLVDRLIGRGDDVVVLSRSAERARRELHPDAEVVEGDPAHPGTWQREVERCDAVVNLAGENLFARRWTTPLDLILHNPPVGLAGLLNIGLAAAAVGVLALLLMAPDGPRATRLPDDGDGHLVLRLDDVETIAEGDELVRSRGGRETARVVVKHVEAVNEGREAHGELIALAADGPPLAKGDRFLPVGEASLFPPRRPNERAALGFLVIGLITAIGALGVAGAGVLLRLPWARELALMVASLLAVAAIAWLILARTGVIDAGDWASLEGALGAAAAFAAPVILLTIAPPDDGDPSPFKRRIRSSRIDATRQLARAIAGAKGPSVFIAGSAIGYYGPRDDEPLDESAKPGDDFLARLCADWEAAADEANGGEHDVRVVKLRTGVVLDRRGGPLVQMDLPFRFFAGGPVGNGRQWMSWIHWEDELGLIIHALDNPEVRGPMNATAPEPLPNREVASALGRALRRPAMMPTPALGLRLALGEVSDVVTEGQRVVPKLAKETGYGFKFRNLEDALADLYRRPA